MTTDDDGIVDMAVVEQRLMGELALTAELCQRAYRSGTPLAQAANALFLRGQAIAETARAYGLFSLAYQVAARTTYFTHQLDADAGYDTDAAAELICHNASRFVVH